MVKKSAAKPPKAKKKATKTNAGRPGPKKARPKAPDAEKRAVPPGELGAALLEAAQRVRSYPEIDVRAVLAGDAGGILALGKETGDFWALPMPELHEAISLPFRDVHCGWTSRSGATYLGTWHERPIVRHHEGKLEYVALELPRGEEVDRVTHLTGQGGATPDEDTIFCIAAPYVINELPTCSFCWRVNGKWHAAKLPLGHPGALAAANGEAYLSVGPTWPPDVRTGQLLRWSNGQLETLPFPPEEQGATAVVGMHASADGRLLAFFGWGDKGIARPWLRERNGKWSRVAAPQGFFGWAGLIGCHEWNGVVRVLTQQGIFTWDGHALNRETTFNPVSLWPVGDLLFASASQRKAQKLQFLDGTSWKALHVPEPDVIAGGQGKVVGLGAGKPVPVRKLRMKMAELASSTGRAAPGSISLAAFLARLAALSDARRRPLDVRAQLERDHGVPMAADLRAFFDLHQTHELDHRLGHFQVWPGSYMRWPDTRSTTELVASVYTEVAPIIAALTGTVHLGADAGGQVYFARVDEHRSEVFLYGPGVGELKPLTDSFEAFAELNEIEEQCQEYCKREGLDADDLGDAKILAAPELRALGQALRARARRLHLSGYEGSDVASDFDATMTRLAGTRLGAKFESLVPRLFERAEWLVGLFTGIGARADAASRSFEEDMDDPAMASLAATKVYWLWHLYLFDRREQLAALLEPTRRDQAGLVRATARLIEELLGEAALPASLEPFRQMRSEVAAAARPAGGRARPGRARRSK